MRIFGIKNCDTMKKAFKWLEDHHITYDFHDYKKHGVDEDVLTMALARHGWQKVINQRGTSWRRLSDDVKQAVDHHNSIALCVQYPSLIKRPLLVQGDVVELGFSPQRYAEIL